jgi:hypothetical protein
MKKSDVDKLIVKTFGGKTGRFNHFLSLLILVVGLLGCNSKNESSIAQNEAGVVEPIDTICSCPQCVIKLLPYDESAGFTTKKENVETLINENINEIKYIFDRYQNDSLDEIDVVCHKMDM